MTSPTVAPDIIVASAAMSLAHMYMKQDNDFDLPKDLNAPLALIKPYTPYELMKATFKVLFENSKNNSEFKAYARTFLTSAHLQAYGDTGSRFFPEVDSRHTTITIYRDRGSVETHWEFTYDSPLSRPRPDWHTFFMNKAFDMAERSTCASGRRVGAVYVRDHVALVSSYNGVPSGYDHPTVCPRIAAGCASGEGLDMCPCNHAETNGLALAARNGISLKGARLYCTSKPCSGCMGILANVGLSAIVYADDYPSAVSDKIAKKANLTVMHISEAINYD